MSDSTKMLKREIAELQAELARKQKALAILEPQPRMPHTPTMGDMLDPLVNSPEKRKTVAFMAEQALVKAGRPMTPKDIQSLILSVFQEDVNPGTLASVLWRGAMDGSTFKQVEPHGHYGLLTWDPGPTGKTA